MLPALGHDPVPEEETQGSSSLSAAVGNKSLPLPAELLCFPLKEKQTLSSAALDNFGAKHKRVISASFEKITAAFNGEIWISPGRVVFPPAVESFVNPSVPL